MPFIFYAKISILDVWLGSEYAFDQYKLRIVEQYLGPCQISKMGVFAKIVNS